MNRDSAMMRLFTEQHAEILQILRELQSKAASDVQAHYKDIARLLIKLRFKVKLHLASEDKILFPVIRNEGNCPESALLAGYEAEMQGLAGVFLEFIHRWEYAEQILERSGEFLKETTGAIDALTRRIAREEQELYPAIARLEQKFL